MGIVDKFLRPWAAGNNWPPLAVEEWWQQVGQYRMRGRNDHGEMLQHTPAFNQDEDLAAAYTPVPIAREMARLSASLLFADPAKITLPDEEARKREERAAKRAEERDKRNPMLNGAIGGTNPDPEVESKPTEGEQSDKLEDVVEEQEAGPGHKGNSKMQQLLADFLDENGLDALLMSAGEQIALEGVGALRVIRDTEVNDGEPYVDFVPEDQILWDLRYGRAAVGGTVVWEWTDEHRGIDGDSVRVVYRMLEEHTVGQVDRTVYKGGTRFLGKVVGFNEWPETWRGVKPRESTGLDKPTLIRWENVPGAASDIQGLESLLDTLNEAESYFTLKGRASIPLTFADRSLLDDSGVAKLHGIIASKGGTEYGKDLAGRVAVMQPELQSVEHEQWVNHVRDMIVQHAGYSSATWGLGEEGATPSGTALQLRQARTLLNRAGKDRMAREAIRNVVAIGLAWKDGASEVADYRPEVKLGLGLPEDNAEKAAGVAQARTAGVMSKREAVTVLHPDWSADQIDEELEMLEDETQQTSPNPLQVEMIKQQALKGEEVDSDSPVPNAGPSKGAPPKFG